MNKMSVQEIKDYKVIDCFKTEKGRFNVTLDHLYIIGTFKNEFGELFVIYREADGSPFRIYGNRITGDEFGWENNWFVYSNGGVSKSENFMLNKEETEKMRSILKEYGDK